MYDPCRSNSGSEDRYGQPNSANKSSISGSWTQSSCGEADDYRHLMPWAAKKTRSRRSRRRRDRQLRPLQRSRIGRADFRQLSDEDNLCSAWMPFRQTMDALLVAPDAGIVLWRAVQLLLAGKTCSLGDQANHLDGVCWQTHLSFPGAVITSFGTCSLADGSWSRPLAGSAMNATSATSLGAEGLGKGPELEWVRSGRRVEEHVWPATGDGRRAEEKTLATSKRSGSADPVWADVIRQDLLEEFRRTSGSSKS